MKTLSPKFPLFFSSEGDYSSNKTIKEVVKQNFKNLVLTSPGERIMIPDFGVGIRNYLFEQNDIQISKRILERLNQQIEKFMPFIEIQSFSPNFEENEMVISIQYFIIPISDSDILSVRL